ncbi:hypothetical protein DSO57_1031596 [Entomophthora muscae]|uniref:Uncharacterized protein n=1 Tax=Entomophthora muscae TaxID=34485 RepID=A0ACC2SDH6_9FUNG|nr:hypothetical protein DSO57_1031596 [Entomophthora muscae]
MKLYHLALFGFALSNPLGNESSAPAIDASATIELPARGDIVQGTSNGVILSIADECSGETSAVEIIFEPEFSQEGGKVNITGDIPWKNKDDIHFSHLISDEAFPIQAMMMFSTPKNATGLIKLSLFAICKNHTSFIIKHEFPILTIDELNRENKISTKISNAYHSSTKWLADLHNKNYYWQPIKEGTKSFFSRINSWFH